MLTLSSKKDITTFTVFLTKNHFLSLIMRKQQANLNSRTFYKRPDLYSSNLSRPSKTEKLVAKRVLRRHDTNVMWCPQCDSETEEERQVKTKEI